MRSLIAPQLIQRQVRLHIDWVNAKWDSTSTELMRNDEIFLNVGAFYADTVDVESHSELTQLTWSLTPRWLSWQGVSLRIDPVCGRLIKPKQRNITSSGAFKEIVFRKINYCSGPWKPGSWCRLSKAHSLLGKPRGAGNLEWGGTGEGLR
jgi:hypothetical protein